MRNELSKFIGHNGRLKVILVYKKSRFQVYTEIHPSQRVQALVEQNDVSVEKLKKAHDAHVACLGRVRNYLEQKGINYETAYRAELKQDQFDGRLVITVGGDGTMLDASHFVVDSPVLGVNSAPEFSVGSLCAATADTFEERINQIEEGSIRLLPLTRACAELDGHSLPYFGLNEILVAHRNPAATSRYVLRFAGVEEEQNSSGIWFGAPAGSTGALISAGGDYQALHDNRLQMRVREAYFVKGHTPRLLAKWIPKTGFAEVISKMPGGQIYFDGPYRSVPFPLGSRVKISGNGHPLSVFMTDTLEVRRIQLAKLRLECRSQ